MSCLGNLVFSCGVSCSLDVRSTVSRVSSLLIPEHSSSMYTYPLSVTKGAFFDGDEAMSHDRLQVRSFAWKVNADCGLRMRPVFIVA